MWCTKAGAVSSLYIKVWQIVSEGDKVCLFPDHNFQKLAMALKIMLL